MTNEEAAEIIKSIDKAYRTFSKEEYKALEMAIEALEQEPCEDAISRQAVLSLVSDGREGLGNIIYAFDVERLPSVSTEKTGHWKKVISYGYGDDTSYICECSECKGTVSVYNGADSRWKHCPNCGAKMVESENEDEKEN